MKITSLSVQVRDKNRVNVSVDGKYRFSLDIAQVSDSGIKVGNEYDEEEILNFERESSFGKLYMRSLEYSLIRQRSSYEIRDYLRRKTRTTLDKKGNKKPGYSSDITDRVYKRLVEKGYIDDQKFANYWVNNRFVKKGVSRRRLVAELIKKGVKQDIIDRTLSETVRSDSEEIQKIITKKKSHYSDERKLVSYLARQGFSYDDIKTALSNNNVDFWND